MMKNECGMLNAECGTRRRNPSLNAAIPRASFSIQQSAFSTPPRGITLIELMVTMVIIAIISAAILGTASAAMENARRTRTQTLITRISGLVLERWDSYGNRRVDINPAIRTDIDTWANAATTPQERAFRNATRGQMLADARLLALRELMKMEMPDRWSDIVNRVVPTNNGPIIPTILATPPALVNTYFRRMQEVQGHADFLANQQAECLYLTVMYATGDGEARTLFSSQDIGDTDGDGAPEFLDGWGQPIRWLRWAPGFAPQSPLLTGDAEGDHDPFDIWKRDSPSVTTPEISLYQPPLAAAVNAIRLRNQRVLNNNEPRLAAYRIVPLVYSIGPDEESGIVIGQINLPGESVLLDPYWVTGDDDLLGSPLLDEETWRDNIHNHLNEY